MRHGYGRTGMTPGLRRGTALSAGLHVAVLVAILLGLPHISPPEEPPPEEQAVAMVFPGDAATSVQAPTPSPTPAPATDSAPPAPPVTKPPTPQPTEAPPPPPPPSPPPPPPETAPAPPMPTPPAPRPDPTPEPSPVPPPPPPPPAPPSPPPPQATPQPPLPMPPPPAPPPPAPPSTTSQPNVTKNPAPNSDSVENTMEKLRQLARQQQAPSARPNPRQGGNPAPGGSPTGNDTASLSAAQRGEIGEHVRECWTKDAGALDLEKMSVVLTVTTDGAGTARQAVVADEDRGKLSDPRFRAFSERAVRAVLDVRCANLPLPKTMMGANRTLTFRFRP